MRKIAEMLHRSYSKEAKSILPKNYDEVVNEFMKTLDRQQRSLFTNVEEVYLEIAMEGEINAMEYLLNLLKEEF